MKKDIAEKWVADLRTPGLKQTKSKLFDGEGFCCLGRLCIVLGHEFIERDGYFYVKGTYVAGYVPASVAKKAGLAAGDGRLRVGRAEINGDSFTALSDANDAGATFPQIADWIEQNWERL